MLHRPASLPLVPLLALLALPAGAEEARPALEAVIRAEARSARATLGVAVVHLGTGRSVGANARGRFPMASVFKLPVAVVVLSRVDAGELSLDREVEVRPGDLRRTGDEVDPWAPGGRVPVGRLLESMMTRSDNTACDVLLRVLGGPRAVDAWLDAHGFPGIDVSLSELEMAAAASGVADLPEDRLCDHACLDALVARVPRARRAAAARAFEKDPRNTASPADLARLLVELEKGTLLSKASSETLLSAMRDCRTGDRRIRALLPRGTPVRDKTGTMGRSANDVGLVELPRGKGTLAVVVLVRESARNARARERAIARVARAAFDEFSR